MKLRISPLASALALALGAAAMGVAYAGPVNLIQNGTFSGTSPTQSTPTQFGPNSGSDTIGDSISGNPPNTRSCSWGGQFVTGWAGEPGGGYGIWYPSANAATTVTECTTYGSGSTQMLPSGVTAPPDGTLSFVGLDGQKGLNFSLSQKLTGLKANQKYTVSFDWAATQEMSRTGATSDTIQVALGNEALMAPVNACSLTSPSPTGLPGADTWKPYSTTYTGDCGGAPSGFSGTIDYTAGTTIGTHGFSGWMPASFTFTPTTGSEVLSFLSIGTPAELPPFAVLTNVSMFASVPEPAELGEFGLGLGLLGIALYWRKRRSARGDVRGRA